jgi:hypothetical protein
VPRDSGFSYALIIHAIPYITGILLGAIVLLRWGISIKSLIGSRDADHENNRS